MRRIAITSAFAFFSVMGCAAPEPPSNPSWQNDVFPLLQGSCLGCHGGATADNVGAGGGIRFDVCNPMAFGDLTTAGNQGAGTISGALIIENSIKPTTKKRMPPPPAPPLDDYERKVLQNWTKRVMGGAKIEDLCRKSRNGKPTARLVESRKDGSALVGILEIADPDGEQVYGKASVGGNSTSVRAGRHEFRIDNANGDRLEVKFSDGYDTVDQTFDL